MKKIIIVLLIGLCFGCSKDDEVETVYEEIEVCPDPKPVVVKYYASCVSCGTFEVQFLDPNGNMQTSLGTNAAWSIEFETLQETAVALMVKTNEDTSGISVFITQNYLDVTGVTVSNASRSNVVAGDAVLTAGKVSANYQ